jgi:hypothetical protein
LLRQQVRRVNDAAPYDEVGIDKNMTRQNLHAVVAGVNIPYKKTVNAL